jgi:hypothetical protein
MLAGKRNFLRFLTIIWLAAFLNSVEGEVPLEAIIAVFILTGALAPLVLILRDGRRTGLLSLCLGIS